MCRVAGPAQRACKRSEQSEAKNDACPGRAARPEQGFDLRSHPAFSRCRKTSMVDEG